MANFFKDMFHYVGMMMVSLVLAICISAIILEGYEWFIKMWGVFFD